jgi:hypothetical protein
MYAKTGVVQGDLLSDLGKRICKLGSKLHAEGRESVLRDREMEKSKVDS